MNYVRDEEIWKQIENEKHRQKKALNLIASENIAPIEIQEVMASCLSNKYAEGYPGRRYYSGCQFIDEIEKLAIQRAKKLFRAEHANVQPHAGSQANMAVYHATLKPGDTVLGMQLSSGGHLTHGHPANFSGSLYNFVSYGVHKETECIDYDEVEQLALEHKPKLIVCGASAYSRIIDFEKFGAIAQKVGAYLMADMAHIAGLVATELHPSPIPFADFVTSTTHKTMRGPRGAFILCKKEHEKAIDKAVMPGTQGGPFMHAIGAKAIMFKNATEDSFKKYQQQVIKNAAAMAEEFKKRGYRIVSEKTENHLMLIDLQSKNITGKDAEIVLAQNEIYVNRNTIPFDPQSPFITSGIRVGTPLITSQGKTEKDISEIVSRIDSLLKNFTKA
jgi:glycine hydroxymethyltransferase